MTPLRADGLLLVTATLWGFAFVAQRAGMAHVGPYTFNGVRFALGTAVLLLYLRRRGPSGQTRPVGWAGLLAGGVLFAGASLQQVGLVHTTAGKAGFITGLYVLFVPLLGLIWVRPAGGTWVGVGLAVVGLYLLSVTEQLTLGRGDGLVVIAAACFAAHVLVIGWRAPGADPIKLAAIQFAVVAIASLAVAGWRETITFAGLRGAGWAIAYGGLLSVGVAYTLQVVAQRQAPATHAAIIMSLEAVFGALGGWLWLNELLGPRELAGCGLMIGGMLISQLAEVRAARRRIG